MNKEWDENAWMPVMVPGASDVSDGLFMNSLKVCMQKKQKKQLMFYQGTKISL